MKDEEKKQRPHVFRWLNHVQNISGLKEVIENHGLKVELDHLLENRLGMTEEVFQEKLARMKAIKEKLHVKE
jgi:hypothetical protein